MISDIKEPNLLNTWQGLGMSLELSVTVKLTILDYKNHGKKFI